MITRKRLLRNEVLRTALWVSAFFLFCAAGTYGQTSNVPAMTQPPDLTAPTAAAGSSQTDLMVALQKYKSWAESQILAALGAAGTIDVNEQKDAAAITALQGRLDLLQGQYNDLEAQVAVLKNAVSVPSTPGPTPVAVTFFADTASTGINAGDVQTSGDTAPTDGNKLILAAGRAYTYPAAIPGQYALSARLSSDTGTTGTIKLHLESPAGVALGVNLTASCGATWATVSAVVPATVGSGQGAAMPIIVVADSVCSGRSYANWFTLTPAPSSLLNPTTPYLGPTFTFTNAAK